MALDLDALATAPAGPYTVHSVIGACEIHATHLDRTLAMHVAPDVAALFAAAPALRDALREDRSANAYLRDVIDGNDADFDQINADHNATIAALHADLAEAKRDNDELHATLDRQSAILRDTAVALRGEPPPLTSWGSHDLAERARALRDALAYAASPDAAHCDECGYRGYRVLATQHHVATDGDACDACATGDGWSDLPHAATLREVTR